MISDSSNPLFVVGGRAESQLSLDVMVHKARPFAVESVSLWPIGQWLTLGSFAVCRQS